MQDFIVQTLETERLILRPLQSSDAPCIYKHFANDAKVTQYLTWQPHANVQKHSKRSKMDRQPDQYFRY